MELFGPPFRKRSRDLMPGVTILLVEDNPDDAALTEVALRGLPAHIEVARDGQEAIDYMFNQANDLPRLVLLDLRLPNIDGLEVLRRIRQNERTCLTPVVILTSSTAPDDITTGYRSGANSYVCKPLDLDEFSGLLRELGAYWLVLNSPPSNTSDH
jgi:CheY-like chemotaxis protein